MQNSRIKHKNAPFRQRFFSSMDYEQYQKYFGPPSPLLKPSADPEELDYFELNPEKSKQQQAGHQQLFQYLPPIKQTINEQEMSNMASQRKQSHHIEMEDFIRETPKRSMGRMRSQSENHAYLIFSFLQRSDKTLKSDQFRLTKKVKRDQL